MTWRSAMIAVLLVVAASRAAAQISTATPTPTFSASPLPPTRTPTPTFSASPLPPTRTPTPTFSASPLPPTRTPTATFSASPLPPTRTPTATFSASPTPTRTRTFTPTIPLGLSITDVSIVEGDSGTRSAVFGVRLRSGPLSQVRVTATTANGTAAAPSDYDARSQQLVFQVGQVLSLFSVVVHGDQTFELDETFTVTLSNPLGAPIGDPIGVGRILNDDNLIVGVPALSPSDPVAAPGEQTALTLRWTHPQRWRELNTVDLRLVDGDRVVLWVRFDEAANTLAPCDADGVCGTGLSPGTGAPIAGDAATFYPADSAVQGSGPTGPNVDLTFAFSLDAALAGALLRVETAATDDSGAEQGFLPIAYLTVTDAGGGSDDDGCAIQPPRGGGGQGAGFLALGLLALIARARRRNRPSIGVIDHPRVSFSD